MKKKKSKSSIEKTREVGRKILEELKAKGPDESSIGKSYVIVSNVKLYDHSNTENNDDLDIDSEKSRRRELLKLRMEILQELSESRSRLAKDKQDLDSKDDKEKL